MARTNLFSHDADGNRPADHVSLFGYDYCIVGENIAYQVKSHGFKTGELASLIFDTKRRRKGQEQSRVCSHENATRIRDGRASGERMSLGREKSCLREEFESNFLEGTGPGCC